jgi:hypothetical protein
VALAAAAALLSSSLLFCLPAACLADEGAAPALPVALNAPELFARTCAGCHAGGGNVVDMSHSLRAPDLARDGLTDTTALYDVIYRGKVRALLLSVASLPCLHLSYARLAICRLTRVATRLTAGQDAWLRRRVRAAGAVHVRRASERRGYCFARRLRDAAGCGRLARNAISYLTRRLLVCLCC